MSRTYDYSDDNVFTKLYDRCVTRIGNITDDRMYMTTRDMFDSDKDWDSLVYNTIAHCLDVIDFSAERMLGQELRDEFN